MDDYGKEVVNLGLVLRELRHSKGWTLEETEENGWDDWKYLQRIESGKNITIKTFLKICDLYKIRPSKVFQKVENMEK